MATNTVKDNGLIFQSLMPQVSTTHFYGGFAWLNLNHRDMYKYTLELRVWLLQAAMMWVVMGKASKLFEATTSSS